MKLTELANEIKEVIESHGIKEFEIFEDKELLLHKMNEAKNSIIERLVEYGYKKYINFNVAINSIVDTDDREIYKFTILFTKGGRLAKNYDTNGITLYFKI